MQFKTSDITDILMDDRIDGVIEDLNTGIFQKDKVIHKWFALKKWIVKKNVLTVNFGFCLKYLHKVTKIKVGKQG